MSSIVRRFALLAAVAAVTTIASSAHAQGILPVPTAAQQAPGIEQNPGLAVASRAVTKSPRFTLSAAILDHGRAVQRYWRSTFVSARAKAIGQLAR